jgi:excisionase family DNA binding protein
MQTQVDTSSDVGLLDRKQAAKKLTISERALHDKIHQNKIPYVKIGRFYRFLPRDLDAYIEAHRIEKEEK